MGVSAFHGLYVATAEAADIGGLYFAGRTRSRVARQRTLVLAALLSFTLLATRMRQLILVAIRLPNTTAETVIIRHLFTVVVTALRTRPHEHLEFNIIA